MNHAELIALLETQAEEIAEAGHFGWGNTLREAAAALQAAQPVPLVPMARGEIDDLWAACSDDDGANIYELARAIEAHHSGHNAELRGAPASARPPG
jgi:hypothetical protein